MTSLSPITSLALPLPGHCLFSGVSQSWGEEGERGRGERERERERERGKERKEREGGRERGGGEGESKAVTYLRVYVQSI